ncbi:hypothetical protein DOTSEDRAFT_74692 [Dothistroma septosporum NZE10]|uniref:Uncharacterized protein n=1 Tax=Dothistroma septosporum (strain NZE10 / CBS 128990) TaxID=675120 RepID=N1PE81_DOTSN|nr:hypothetical protein DOTSEDRAFT_74692 [Dothistroma septosporum NZE10]
MASPVQQDHDKHPRTLLSLPAEIRNQTYHLLLISSHPINLALEDGGRQATVRIQNWYEVSPSANILATCHQLHREASAYLYSDNTFTFRQDPRTLSAFLSRIKTSAGLVQGINIVNPYRQKYGRSALEALHLAPNLRKLQIAYVPKFIYEVNAMASLLVGWAKARGVRDGDALEELRFYHVAASSANAGEFRDIGPKLVETRKFERVVESYTKEVKARILRLLQVEVE